MVVFADGAGSVIVQALKYPGSKYCDHTARTLALPVGSSRAAQSGEAVGFGVPLGVIHFAAEDGEKMRRSVSSRAVSFAAGGWIVAAISGIASASGVCWVIPIFLSC